MQKFIGVMNVEVCFLHVRSPKDFGLDIYRANVKVLGKIELEESSHYSAWRDCLFAQQAFS